MSKNLLEKYLPEISKITYKDEKELIENLKKSVNFTNLCRTKIESDAKQYVKLIRSTQKNFVNKFMKEYSLSNEEGIAIICLAESLLRIPDARTANQLIKDKLQDKNWKEHLAKQNSLFTNASTWGLMLTGKIVKLSDSSISLNKLINKLGEPIILQSLKQAVKLISNTFILGSNLDEALKSGIKYEKQGFLFSFDLLGESSRTHAQAEFYYNQYLDAIATMHSFGDKKNAQPMNLSVKLSALHPKVLLTKEKQLMIELLPKLKELAQKCATANISLTFDAEESFRQEIYLKIIHRLITEKSLKDYHNIGFVLQAYSKRTFKILDYVIDLAKDLKRKIPVRLVKGAYWDSEIKHSQEMGLEGYPVFTNKEFTDISYIACANKILANIENLYPQFATHNALTVATIKHMALSEKISKNNFEFQKLQGMGDELYNSVVKEYRCRIYAPVGNYKDLLAYLMRRLLENGANSSFVNLVADDNAKIENLIKNPFDHKYSENSVLPSPLKIYGDERKSSQGYELGISNHLEQIQKGIDAFANKEYKAYSYINGKKIGGKKSKQITSPLDRNDVIGKILKISDKELISALEICESKAESWANLPVEQRASCLNKFADLLFEHRFEFYSLLIREAGKNIYDAIAEVREAIDFARYYAAQSITLMKNPISLPGYTGEKNELSLHPRGTFVCISPWNFPLAIFCGQILAALATGNAVIAKSAENTSIVGFRAVELMLASGIHKSAINFVIAGGRQLSTVLLPDNRISGVCFTGSSEVALGINRTLAARNTGIAPVIAETGGQNAMIIDSSALLEQATDDIINSAFGSMGQRCSALRVAFIQEEIFEPLLKMVSDAMCELKVGNTADLSTDLGSIIDEKSKQELQLHIAEMSDGLFKVHPNTKITNVPNSSYFAPAIIRLNSISELTAEKFGPILHVIPFKSKNLDKIIQEINDTGFGLTFGIQTRIEEKIAYVASKIKAGNIYANRTIIGAQVGTQPFGGQGLSGTGFKAGGPHYLLKFVNEKILTVNTAAIGGNIELLS